MRTDVVGLLGLQEEVFWRGESTGLFPEEMTIGEWAGEEQEESHTEEVSGERTSSQRKAGKWLLLNQQGYIRTKEESTSAQYVRALPRSQGSSCLPQLRGRLTGDDWMQKLKKAARPSLHLFLNHFTSLLTSGLLVSPTFFPPSAPHSFHPPPSF